MRIAVTGSNGYIGKALVERGCFRLLCDVMYPGDVAREIGRIRPDIILHLAAKSKPEFCELPENRERAIWVNKRGTQNVLFAASNVPVVLFSTGQIWKGGLSEFRPHKEHDKPSPPVNFYGLTKLAAEGVAHAFENARIVRLSAVFDVQCLAPRIEALARGEILSEPTFLKRSFIYIEDFVDSVLHYVENFSSMPKVLHLAGSETTSYYNFIRHVASRYVFFDSVKPRLREVKGYAPRPRNGGLDVSLAQKLGFNLPDYNQGIQRMRRES